MDDVSARYNAMFENLRSLTRGEVPDRLHASIRRAVEDFLGQRPPGEEGRGAWMACASKMALRLFLTARRTEADALRLVCVSCMLQLGPFGWILAAEALAERIVTPKQLRPLLDELPPEIQFGAVDRMQHARTWLDKEARQFVIDRLGTQSEAEPEVGLRFLKKEGRYEPGPAFALVAALLRGQLSDQVREALSDDDELREMRDLAHVFQGQDVTGITTQIATILGVAPPRRVPLLLDILVRLGMGGQDMVKSLVGLLNSGNKEAQLAALDTLALMRAPQAPKLFAKTFAKLAPLRKAVIPRLALLDYDGFRVFFAHFKKEDHPKLLWPLFLFAARLDPDCMAECIYRSARTVKTAGPAKAAAQALLAHTPTTAPPVVDEPASPEEAPKDNKSEAPARKDKKKFGLFGGKKDEGGDGLLGGFGGYDDDAGGSGRVVRGEVFEDRTFTRASYARSIFIGASFENCRFEDCRMAEAVFKDCRFESTVLAGCDLKGARFFRTSFSDCELTGGFVDQAVWSECSLNLCRLENLAMGGLCMVATEAASTLWRTVDLSGAQLDGVTLHACEFEACHFDNAQLTRIHGEQNVFSATSLRGASVASLTAFHPVLKALERRGFTARFRELAAAPAPAAKPPGRDGLALAVESLRRWYMLRQLTTSLADFIANNQRRVDWGMEKLGRDKAAFYAMAPVLMATDDFDKARGLEKTPPFVPTGYRPTYRAVASAREHFPDLKWDAGALAGAAELRGIYTIGSLGTLAQGAGSDLDYWVCAQLRDMEPAIIERLSAKLESITDWADETLGLEAYFFLMDTNAVRQNNFGFSDKESSGSAQALLLKEEFYRTAVLVAGLPPVWWFTPPNASQKQYDAIKKRIAALLGPDAALDLGHMAPIPQEEFFGASLWQIVKGLKSPFKSILKFGLLDLYTSEEEEYEASLLCDRIKNNIFTRRTTLWDVDPYVSMFREVMGYYERVGNQQNLSLINLSFSLKANLADAQNPRLPLRKEERESLDIVRLTAQSSHGKASQSFAREMDFHKLIAVGKKVNAFMVNTYVSVRDKQGDTEQTAITPEDMTKLGRKIAVYFSAKENKIERVPILKLKSDFFTELHLQVSFPLNVRTWEIQGGKLDEATSRVKVTSLKKGTDLASMLAWATANHLFDAGTTVKADRLAHPVTDRDVAALIAALSDFFTEKNTFETDIAEMLETERVMRAMFITNLTQPKENAHLSEITVMYATNWGELCYKALDEVGSISSDVPAFLHQLLELPVDEKVALAQFTPPRSSCPRFLG